MRKCDWEKETEKRNEMKLIECAYMYLYVEERERKNERGQRNEWKLEKEKNKERLCVCAFFRFYDQFSPVYLYYFALDITFHTQLFIHIIFFQNKYGVHQTHTVCRQLQLLLFTPLNVCCRIDSAHARNIVYTHIYVSIDTLNC